MTEQKKQLYSKIEGLSYQCSCLANENSELKKELNRIKNNNQEILSIINKRIFTPYDYCLLGREQVEQIKILFKGGNEEK